MAGRKPVSLSIRCERARHWASLRLDGELSTLEGELLERHLGSCEACRKFEARIALAASLLREAPAETSARSIAAPHRSPRFSLPARKTALVAAAALVLGTLTGALFQRPAPAPEPVRAPQFSFLSRDLKQLQQLPRRQEQTTPVPVPSGPPNPPEGVI
jgi:hypothetical protein